MTSFPARQALPRLLADFLLIHLCMASAAVAAIAYHAAASGAAAAVQVGSLLGDYYLRFFLAISPLFPAVFLLSGFYTRAIASGGRAKVFLLLRGVGLATLLFLAANFLFFREQLLPRSAILFFCFFSIASLLTARYLKSALVARYDIRARQPGLDRPARSVLIVGGAGYIGSVLARALLDSGRRVRVLDSLLYGDHSLRDLRNHPRFELIQGDCRNIQNVVRAVRGVDAVIHLAAIVGDPACDLDRTTALEVNYAATRMLLEIAKGHGVSRFLFASSCSVYGATESVVDESSSVAPISVYAQTKIDAEQAILDAQSPSFYPTILRLATVFGHSYRPRFDLVVNLLTARAAREGSITIYNGSQWRPFIHVADVARGFLAVLDARPVSVSGEIFNLGDSRWNATLSGLAGHIREAFPSASIENIDNADRRNYRVSFDKARTRLNFSCRLSLADGIAEIKRALESGAIPDYTSPLYHNHRFLQASPVPAPPDLDSRLMTALSVSSKAASA